MTKTASSSLQLWLFFFAQIVFFADFQNIIFFFRTFSESFYIDYIYMGFLVSIYSIFTLLSPIFGSLSDLYGRKGFLLLGLILFTLSSLIIFNSSNMGAYYNSSCSCRISKCNFPSNIISTTGG